MLYRFVIASAILAAASAAPVSAQAPKPAAPAAAGGMAKSAFLNNVNNEFVQMDANKDGKVTASEVQQFRTQAVLARARQRNRGLFNQLDVDKNGYISAQEFAKLVGPAPTLNVQPLMTRLDTNHDQQLSQAEYRAGATADFDRLDVNKDGMLSPAEARTNNSAPAQR